MASDKTQSTMPSKPDLSRLKVVELHPVPTLKDYREAMKLAESEAMAHLGEYMLLSWYDRDRNFEAPQHVSECHQDSAVPGYVDYALYRDAYLKVDVENGRFVFFYRQIDL